MQETLSQANKREHDLELKIILRALHNDLINTVLLDSEDITANDVFEADLFRRLRGPVYGDVSDARHPGFDFEGNFRERMARVAAEKRGVTPR